MTEKDGFWKKKKGAGEWSYARIHETGNTHLSLLKVKETVNNCSLCSKGNKKAKIFINIMGIGHRGIY